MLIEVKAKFNHAGEICTGKFDLSGIHAVRISDDGTQWLSCNHNSDLPIHNDILPMLSPDDFLHCALHENCEEVYLRRSCIWGYVETGSTLSVACGKGIYGVNPQLLDEVISIVEKNTSVPA